MPRLPNGKSKERTQEELNAFALAKVEEERLHFEMATVRAERGNLISILYDTKKSLVAVLETQSSMLKRMVEWQGKLDDFGKDRIACLNAVLDMQKRHEEIEKRHAAEDGKGEPAEPEVGAE